MSRLRDQQLLSYAAGRVWATAPETKNLLVSILARHYRGVRLGEDELAEIRQASSARPADQTGKGGVAVVPLWGALVPHAGMMADVSTAGTGLDEWCSTFMSAVDHPDVSTVVIRVNSPGGSAEGVTEAAKVIRSARASKRIVAVADGMAASAAYALASQADELYATPSGFVGAVHCYTIHEDISAMLEQEGIKFSLIGAPNDGAAEDPDFLPLSDDNRAHLQSMVNQFYDRFVSDVAQGRGVDESAVRAGYGSGRVLTAPDALAAGMVDGVRSFEEVMTHLVGGGRRSAGRARADVASATAQIAASASGGSLVVSTGATYAIPLTTSGADLASAVAVTQYEDSAARPAAAEAPSGGTPNEGSTTMDTVAHDGRPASLEELAATRDSLKQQMDELDREYVGRQLPADVQARFDALDAERKDTITTIDNINDRKARLAAAEGEAAVVEVEGKGRSVLSNLDTRKNVPDNPFDLAAYRGFAQTVDDLPKLWKEGALRVNETARYQTGNRERVQGFVEKLLDLKASGSPADSLALRILGTANPLFEEAFAAKMAKRPMSPAQEQAFRQAVSNTGLGSETPVPITIDPTLLLDSDGTTNPIRRLARNVAITGNTWQGLATEGVTFAYSAELAAVDPVTPTFRGPKAEVERAIAEIQGSWEVFADWGSLRQDLAMVLADAKNNAEADKFLNGDGSDEPEGLIWALDDDGTSVVETATVNTLVLDDIRGLDGDLAPRFENSAEWLASKAFYTKANELARAESNYDVWVPIGQGFNTGPDGRLRYSLLGSPTNSASEVSKLFTTGGENVSVLGDFQRGFVIVDRIGMNMLFDEIVRNGDGKIIGASAVIAVVRNTSKLISANAFRMLQIKTS